MLLALHYSLYSMNENNLEIRSFCLNLNEIVSFCIPVTKGLLKTCFKESKSCIQHFNIWLFSFCKEMIYFLKTQNLWCLKCDVKYRWIKRRDNWKCNILNMEHFCYTKTVSHASISNMKIFFDTQSRFLDDILQEYLLTE